MAQSLHVHVASTISFDRHEAPVDFFHALRTHLTWENPEWRKATNMGRSLHKVPSNLCYLRCTSDRAFVPRGAVPLLKRLANDHDVDLVWDSAVTTEPDNGCALDDLDVTLRDYQKDAVDAMISRVQGYVVLPCGGGKTTLGATAAIMLGEPTIICVHTEDLAYQWADTIQRIYYESPRIIGCGTPNNFAPLEKGEIAVCLIQTLSKAADKALPLLKSTGTIIVDECHHVAANSFQRIISRCPARYRWGLTATPQRPDGLDFMLDLHLGPRLFSMTTSELVDLGYLMRPDVHAIYTGWSPAQSDYGKDGRLMYARSVTKACKDADRSRLILDLATRAYEQDRTTMVLVPRVGYANALAERLRNRGITATSVTGKSNKHARKHRLDDVREGRASVIIATQLADEGLDVPNLDCLILASGGKASGRAIQRAGRIMRISDNKQKPIIFDLVDGGPFKSQWRSRATAYQQHLDVTASQPVDRDEALRRAGLVEDQNEILF